MQPICVECGFSLGGPNYNNNNASSSSSSAVAISEHLYDAEQKSLKQCPRCGNTCDPFLETDQVVTGLNIALLRKSAWRHIIHNNTNRRDQTRFLILLFVVSIFLETVVALCWQKSAMKLINEQQQLSFGGDLVGSSSSTNRTQLGFQRLSSFVSSSTEWVVGTNSTSAVVVSAMFSVASSAYSSLFLESGSGSSSSPPPLSFLQPYITSTVEALFPIATPLTLQLSNSSNPFYYSSPSTAAANNQFISEVLSKNNNLHNNNFNDYYHQSAASTKKLTTSTTDADEVLPTKVDLITFFLSSPVMSPSTIETMKMMMLLGFCALAETVLFLVAIVSFIKSGNASSSSSGKKKIIAHNNSHSSSSSTSSSNNNNSNSMMSNSNQIIASHQQHHQHQKPLSATAVTRAVLVAQCARLAFLPFFIWWIPLDLLPLVEVTQIFWYYLASGALTTEASGTRMRRWSAVLLMLFLRSMFRIVTQWAPILGWF